jgi:hypothetical protein
MLLCGWAFGGEEQRQPSDRIIHVRKADIRDSGKVDDFEHRGQQVEWHEVDLDAPVIEEIYLSLTVGSIVPIRLGESLARRPTDGIPVTIQPNGPRPTQTPPLTINP